MTISDIRLKRIYDPVEDRDGTRILIDRLWPRGMSKERAALDAWMPEIGPSHELRKWYAHEPSAGKRSVSDTGKNWPAVKNGSNN